MKIIFCKTRKVIVLLSMVLLMGIAVVLVMNTRSSESFAAVTAKVNPVTGVITIRAEKRKLTVGETTKANIKIEKSYGTIKRVDFLSSNTNVATVDSEGNIKAVGKGIAKITVYATRNTKIRKCCMIYVKDVDLKNPQNVYFTHYLPTDGNNENLQTAYVGKLLKFDSSGKIGIVHPNVYVNENG